DVIGYFLEVPLVVEGDYDRLDAPAVGGEQLLLEPADAQHLAPQGDLTGHRHIGPHRHPAQHRDEGGAHGDAATGAVLARRALGDVQVEVVLAVVELGDAKLLGATAHHGARRLDGFLHDLFQKAGADDLALAGYRRRLDGEQLATHGGPGKAGDLADLVVGFGAAVVETAHPEQILEHGTGDGEGALGIALDVMGHHLAADLGYLALQPTDPGLAGVVADDVPRHGFVDAQLPGLQAIGLELLGQQVLEGNIGLLLLGVAGNAYHLHAVEQRPGNVHGIGGADEQHFGEVVIHLQVVVVEGVVLFRVQHLEQRGSGVAPMVHA